MNPFIETTSVGPSVAVDAHSLAVSRSRQLDASLESAFLAHGPAEDKLAQLFSDSPLCITTGQQPGLLTGPMYTVFKALSAVALAQRFEDVLDRSVVPVFWVAGDDHDFAEANHCNLLTASNEIATATLRDRDAGAPMLPLYKEQVGTGIQSVLDSVAAATPDTEHRPHVLEWIERHYSPNADLSSAFAGALAELLGKFGLVVFNPTHLQSKRVLSPWILRALEFAADIDRELVERAAEIQSQHQPVPVTVGGGASNVMLEATLGRDRLMVEEVGFRTRRSKEFFSFNELRTLMEKDPSCFSANVLLRPVVEAAILPTLAYVAGPGESAYFPQTIPIYDALGVEPQAVVSRWSGRVIDQRTSKTIQRYRIVADELGLPAGSLEAKIVRDQLPEAATLALSRLRETMDREYGTLSEVTSSIDPTLIKPVESAARGALRGLDGIEKRLISHLKKRDEVAVRQIEMARRFLFPLGKPQERVANIVPFLVRYGDSFLDGAYERCVEWADALETSSGGA